MIIGLFIDIENCALSLQRIAYKGRSGWDNGISGGE